ncbi:hypothetical protein MBRA1_001334 [Malassezia brasiliensis]|uniref:Hexosyltransferase n=1 Tax=Malassezia brasiliensis TaxID=1821822 RepID=A0AAF0DRC9_9BASI|nr:hypothetical protein MBRA1_001334 [Malassezia brasiliensis]
MYVDTWLMQDAMAFARFTNVWTKLRAFELTEYERVVLVDSDMLVCRNMDELMDMPLGTPEHPAIAAGFACTCNPNRIPTYPTDWCVAPPCHTHPLTLTRDSPRTHHLLNGGLVVLEPTQAQAEALAAFVATHRAKLMTYRFPDQDLLADLYLGRLLPLPWKYNALKTLPRCHPGLWSDDVVCNVHYILDKPWATGWPGPPDRDVDARLHGWWWAAYHALQRDPARVGLTAEEWATHIAVHVNDAPRREL